MHDKQEIIRTQKKKTRIFITKRGLSEIRTLRLRESMSVASIRGTISSSPQQTNEAAIEHWLSITTGRHAAYCESWRYRANLTNTLSSQRHMYIDNHSLAANNSSSDTETRHRLEAIVSGDIPTGRTPWPVSFPGRIGVRTGANPPQPPLKTDLSFGCLVGAPSPVPSWFRSCRQARQE